MHYPEIFDVHYPEISEVGEASSRIRADWELASYIAPVYFWLD